MSGQATQEYGDFGFSGRDFEAVRTLLRAMAGISLGEDKRELVYARLSRRLRALRLTNFSDYVTLVGSPRGNIEKSHFIDALTTNLTAFFREPHQFDFLATSLLPQLMQRHPVGHCLRVWSAGCSTGEEPCSIAMTALDLLADAPGHRLAVLATDLDSGALARARQGRYARERIDGLPDRHRRRWFRPVTGSNGALVEVQPELRRTITYRRLNLMQPWPEQPPFDLIFCRNVAIYFDRPTREQLFRRFAARLVEGGCLFLGRSESLPEAAGCFEQVGHAIYRKTA